MSKNCNCSGGGFNPHYSQDTSGFDPQYSQDGSCFDPQYSQDASCFNPNYHQDHSNFNPYYAQDISVTVNTDYDQLHNKPLINGVTLIGDKPLTDFELRPIFYGTTASWNENHSIVSKLGAVYIYSDYQTKIIDGEEVNVPGIKIGDGNAYIVDLPFIASSDISQRVKDELVRELEIKVIDKIVDTTLPFLIENTKLELSEEHALVTVDDRINWDNSVTTNLYEEDPENLIFSYAGSV